MIFDIKIAYENSNEFQEFKVPGAYVNSQNIAIYIHDEIKQILYSQVRNSITPLTIVCRLQERQSCKGLGHSKRGKRDSS